MKRDEATSDMVGAFNEGGEVRRGLYRNRSEKVLPNFEELDSPFARLFLAVKDEIEKVEEDRSRIGELSALLQKSASVMESIKNLNAERREVLDSLEAKSEEYTRLKLLIDNLDVNNVTDLEQKKSFLNEMRAFARVYEEEISKFHGVSSKLANFINIQAALAREIAEREKNERLNRFDEGAARIDALAQESSDVFKRMYEAEQNPTFVWLAISFERYCGGKSIPSWCAEYLFQSAENLSELLGDGASIKSNDIAGAFRLIKKGRNSFMLARKDLERYQMAKVIEFLTKSGLKKGRALEKVSNVVAIQERTLQRRENKAKKWHKT